LNWVIGSAIFPHMEREKAVPNNEVRFVYVAHTPENAESTWQKVRDMDTILMECLTPTMAHKKSLNGILSVADKLPGVLKDAFIDSFDPGTPEDSFVEFMVDRALRAGKRLILIDEVQNSQVGINAMDGLLYTRASEMSFRSGSLDRALRFYKTGAENFAKTVVAREVLATYEIQRLRNNNGNPWDRKKIAVIQGAAHTPTYHRYRKLMPEDKVTKVMPKPRYSFYGFSRVVRQSSMTPNKPVTDSEYKRAMISDFAVSEMFASLPPSNQLDVAGEITYAVPLSSIEKHWNSLRTAGQHLTASSAQEYFWKFTRIKRIVGASIVREYSEIKKKR
jgi:hypothetical protein